jgi:tripartite-type tricarboxylate transporter receptor subunit TctC
LPEYVAWVRGTPAKGTYGVPGVGGQPQFLGLMLARASGIELAFVPYKGGALLLTDLLGGQLPAGITLLSDFIRHSQSGKVTVLAISGPQRAATVPGVPTFTELGFATMTGTGWQGFHAPAKTPRPVVDRLSSAIAAALKAPEVGERLLPLGLEIVGSTPDEFARHEAQETARWAPVVKASGYRAEE